MWGRREPMRSRPRVLTVISELRLGGGAQSLLRNVLPALAADFEVHLAVLMDPRDDIPYYQRLSIPVHDLSKNGRLSPWCMFDVARLIRRLKPNVVHSHLTHADIATRFAVRLSGRPPLITSNHLGWSGRERSIGRRLHTGTTRMDDCTITVSEAAHHYLMGKGIDGAQLRVIRNGVDPEVFRPQTGPDVERLRRQVEGAGPVVLAVGRLVPEKAFHTLIAAMRRVVAGIADVRAVIVGEGELHASLHAQMRASGLTEHVTLWGRCEQMPLMYNAADLFVLSSDWEACPMSVLEAMGCQLPVVATDVGDNAILVEHDVTGLMVPPGDPDKLSDAMLTLLRDDDMRVKMGVAGRRRLLARFTLDRTVQQLAALYHEFARQY